MSTTNVPIMFSGGCGTDYVAVTPRDVDWEVYDMLCHGATLHADKDKSGKSLVFFVRHKAKAIDAEQVPQGESCTDAIVALLRRRSWAKQRENPR